MAYWFRIISALLILVCTGSVRTQARAVDAHTAQRAVRGWLAANPSPLQMHLGHSIDTIDAACCASGSVLYYVVHLYPDGFVIVSAEQGVEPIIGFGHTTGAALAPGGLLERLTSADMRVRLQDCVHADASARPRLSRRERKWLRQLDRDTHLHAASPQVEALLEGSVSLKTAGMDDIRVSPLTRSEWGQKRVCGQRTYNYYTPQGLPSGCVATAMAQLMLYHQYPTMGIGVRECNILVNQTDDMAWTRGGDGQGGPYAWADMVFVPDCFLENTQIQSMGALCYDAGIAVYTSYEPSGSGAYGIDIAPALTETFLFSNAITGYDNENNLTVTSNLTDMINPNLDANYPVILGILGEIGHALIVDGYGYNEDTLYHHLNFGFEGAYDIWYNLPHILDYDAVTHCVYNCFPDKEGEIISGRVTDARGQPVPAATVRAISTQGSFSSTTNKKGIYALAGIPAPATYRVTAMKPRLEFRTLMTKLNVSEDLTPITGNRWQVDFRAFAAGDHNKDRQVNLLDFALFAQDWRTSNSRTLSRPELHAVGDANADLIDAFDLKLFLLDWLVGTDQQAPAGAR
jgi:hypothetical protein